MDQYETAPEHQESNSSDELISTEKNKFKTTNEEEFISRRTREKKSPKYPDYCVLY